MPSKLEEKILANPDYTKLIAKQSILRWSFVSIVLLSYFAFIIIALEDPALLATKISAHSIVPIGIPLSILIFTVQIILTIIYARLEKHQFAKLRQRIIEGAKS